MKFLELLSSKSLSNARDLVSDAEAELSEIFPPASWGLSTAVEPYSRNNVKNLWKNELRTQIRNGLKNKGKTEKDFSSWLGEVHNVSIAIYPLSLFETYLKNEGWRLLLFGVPSAGAACVALASHYQGGQNHNALGKASNLLFEFLSVGLQHVGAAHLAKLGRPADKGDWDGAGLISSPASSICGVRFDELMPEGGPALKDVRTTTVKKTIASFISVAPKPARAEAAADWRRDLPLWADLAIGLAKDVYPFRSLVEFENMRSLALDDLPSAMNRFRLKSSRSGKTIVKVFYGPPGTGKTISAVRDAVQLADPKFDTTKSAEDVFARFNELTDQTCFVTFHQSLQYEDLFESIRPVLAGSGANAEVLGVETKAPEEPDEPASGEGTNASGDLRYIRYEGPLLRLVRRAAENPDREYVAVVDEINRGDTSRILGPFISSLEPSKRAGGPFPIGVEMLYSVRPDLESRLLLPSNFHLIGTMNSADRNIALVDYALRRRFDFVELSPDESRLETVLAPDGVTVPPIQLRALLTAINDRIRVLRDKDHCVGHGYFMGCKTTRDVIECFATKVLPLLFEYFYGNEGLILLVLGHRPDRDANILHVEQVENAFDRVFAVDLSAAAAFGFRGGEARASVSVDPRFWNARRLTPGPEDEVYATKAIVSVYETAQEKADA